MTWIETSTGRAVDLVNPDPATIATEDVAHHLSRICRYVGAIVGPHYSVAEHALLVAARLADLGADHETILLGLYHDDQEAYLGDVSGPLKPLLPGYRELEDRMALVVAHALGLPRITPERAEAIRLADRWALACEAWHLLPSQGNGWGSLAADVGFDPREHGPVPYCLQAEVAGALWLWTDARTRSLVSA